MVPILHIFGRDIGSYALMAFIGFFVCAAVISLFCKKINIKFEDTIILILVVAAGLVVGGHFLYGIVNLPEFLKNTDFSSVKNIFNSIIKCFGGMVFYGGFFGGIVALKVYARYSKADFKEYIFDIYAFSIPLFHFFGRIGCFLAGCCYGIESKCGFTVLNNQLVPQINGVKRFPVSLLEAAFNLIIFIVLLILFNKKIFKGKLLYLYMILYSMVRFFTEFLRGDEYRGFFGILSTSQWISVFIFVFSIVTLLRHNIFKKYK